MAPLIILHKKDRKKWQKCILTKFFGGGVKYKVMDCVEDCNLELKILQKKMEEFKMKKLLSFILTAVLCLGMATNVYAYSPTIDNSKCPAPKNVQWSKDGYWQMEWANPGHKSGSYNVHLYKDGQDVYSTTITWYDANQKNYTFSLWENIFESGTYTFSVASVEIDDNYRITYSSDPVFSSNSKTYVRPSKALGTVTANWDAQNPGMLSFKGLESKDVNFYRVNLYREMGEYDWMMGAEWLFAYQASSNIFSCDMSRHILEDGQYYVKVQAFSTNIDVVANGNEGPASGIYDTTITAAAVGNALDAALASGDVATAVETLKTDIPLTSMRTAMQTDSTVLNKVAEVEKAYAEAKGIKVTKNVSAEAAKYVDSSKISMVGAALNADAGNVSLSLSEPETKVKIPANRYENSVQLDLKLFNDNTSKSELEFPITITMPIPAGISVNRLTILHYHQDGSEEIIRPRVNADNTITFTVTKFSTFVFANTIESNYDPIPGVPEEYVVEDSSQEVAFSAADGTAMRWVTAEQNNNFSISGSQANVPAGAVFNANRVYTGDEFLRVAKAVASAKGDVKYVAYDYKLETAAGAEISKFNGHVDISMPIPTEFALENGKVVSVYYLNAAGKLERCNSIVDGNFVTFGTNHLSTFVYIEETAAQVAASPVVNGTATATGVPTSPKTAGVDMTLYMTMLTIAALGVAVYGSRKVKYNR